MNLNMKKTYNASLSLVYEAWTTPEIIKKWFVPNSKWTVEVADMDVSVGGKYRFQMRSDDNLIWTVYGEYKEIKPNEKIVFSWNTEDVKETLVTVEFKDFGGKTEVNLTHDFLPNQEQVDEHTSGWQGCLENLGTKALI